jgi:hypothetical protein
MKNAFNIVVGSLFALVTGFLLYMETAMVFGSPQGDVPTIAFVMFGVGTLGAGYFLLRGTESTGTVFKRSFLMGAIVWIMMVPASLMMSGKAAVETASESGGGEAAQAGAMIGGSLAGVLGTGLSIGISLFCLFLYAVTWFTSREFQEDE